MNRPSSYIKRFGGRSLPIFLALVFTLVLAGSGVAPSNDIGGSDKQDTTRQVVRNLIQVGRSQYEGRLYDQAEKMLTIAQSYQEYLSAAERDYLNELLGKARVAAAKRKRVDESFSKAKELIDEGRLSEARSELLRVRGNETLSPEEQQQLVDALKMLDEQISQQEKGTPKATVERTVPPDGQRVKPAPVRPSGPVSVEANKVAELYHRSMGYYYAGELEKAREGFIEVIASGLIPSPMVKTLQGYLLRIDARLAEEAKLPTTEEPATDETKAMEDLYNKSVELYISGEFEKAREGFIKVAASGLYSGPEGRGPTDYLALIESLMGEMVGPKPFPKETPDLAELLKLAEPERGISEVIEPNVVGEVIEPNVVGEVIEPNVVGEVIEPNVVGEVIEPNVVGEVIEPNMFVEAIEPNVVGADVNEPEAAEEEAKGGYIEVILQKRNILRSHTKAVVRDAADRARSHVSAGEFDKARGLVESALLTVNENKFYLGDDLYKEYIGRLAEVGDEIVAKEAEEELNKQEQARQAAIRAQREFRMKNEQERRERIAELMRNAKTYQRQQRYEAALGQLESLIELEPQNDDALTLRDTLADMVYMRKQLQVQKEGDKQRADILLKTDESGIPYAEEITYPKNWREIIEKPTRKPEPPIGLDPADSAVYEQLNQIVDLSELTQDTPFNEAIEVLKEAVDPPLKIVVIWRDLYENADIEPTRPINMDGLSAVQLGTGLENLLKAVAGGVTGTLSDLGYVVERGIITVATVDSLPSKMETRVYDITDLVGEPANFRGMGGGMMGMGGMGGYGMGGYGMGGMGGYGMGGYGMGGMGGYGMGGYGGGMGGYGGGMGGYG
ncbi:MAG: hypothetical protein JSU94_11090, partial [Phycisphaerales bacterium]